MLVFIILAIAFLVRSEKDIIPLVLNKYKPWHEKFMLGIVYNVGMIMAIVLLTYSVYFK